MVESASDAIIGLTPDRRIVTWNPSAEKLFGYTAEEAVGQAISLILPPDRGPELEHLIGGASAGRAIDQYETVRRRKDGSLVEVSISISPILDEKGEVIGIAGIFRDITERRQAEEQVSLLQTMIMEVAAAGDLSSALEVVVRRVCEKTGWALGQAWVPRQDGATLECSPAWFPGAGDLEGFRAASEGISFPPGVGLPGRVWSSKQPAWIEDVTHDPNFPRAEVAGEIGLQAALGIPILSGDEVLAVIEFFLREPRREDERLVKVIATVAAQLGLVIERKRAEAAQHESQQQYESLVHSIDGIVWELDYSTFRFTFVSQQAERILGYPIGQWFEGSGFWADHIHPDDRSQAVSFCLAASEKGEDHQFEYRMIAADGRIIWLRDIVTVEVTDGRPTRLRGLMVDITERKKEESLRAGQGRVLEMVATGAPLLETLTSLVHLIESQSEGMFCSVLLLDDDGLRVRQGVAPSLPESYVKALDGAPIGPRAGSCGTAMYLGKQVVVTDILEDPLWEDYRDLAAAAGLRACWSTPILSYQGKVLGSFGMYYREPRSPRREETRLTEIATHLAGIAVERQWAEEALRQSEARTRTILQAIPDLMLLLSADGVCLDCHAKHPDELPVPPEVFLGKKLRDVLPSGVAAEAALCFQKATESERSQSFEFELVLNGAVQHYEARIARSGGDRFLGLVRNVTARRRAQEELRRTQAELAHVSRVTTMGELAASIAHEVNQPLGAIVGNADICLHWLSNGQPDLGAVREALSDIISDGHRASEVIARVRALAKKSAPQKAPLDLNEVVGEVLALVTHEAQRRRVRLRAEPAAGLPAVQGDRVQLQQVLLNLVMNGVEAMAGVEDRARELKVSTSRSEAGGVAVAVQDCGVGIDPRETERLFQAFHTTKAGGMGMGLAISRSIVEAHGGRLWAEPNRGPGATFQFMLPAQSERVE